MAFSYKQRMCETCGGPLRYLEDKKVYECTYCGNYWERAESYDGQFSVRYAAEQALSALVDHNYNLVVDNINDCQKIDPLYPGSIVANVAYQLQLARIETDDCARRTAISKAIDYYQCLPESFDPVTCDVEADFYERLSSSDIRSVLQTSFAMLKDDARAEFVSRGLDVSAMHSAIGAAALVERAFSEKNWEQIDQVLKGTAELDGNSILERLLSDYPSCPQKVEDVSAVLARGVDGGYARESLSSYVVTSLDENDCKLAVCDALAKEGISIRGESFAKLSKSEPSAAIRSHAEVMAQVGQSDEDMASIIEATLCSIPSQDIVAILDVFSNAGNYLPFSQKSLIAMLERQDLSIDEKDTILSFCESHGMETRRTQSVLGSLLRMRLEPEVKVDAVAVLVKHVPFVNPRKFEDYLLNSSLDGAVKPQIVELLLGQIRARATLRDASRKYVSSSIDDSKVRMAIVSLLQNEGVIE